MANKIVAAAYDFKASLDLANAFLSSGLTVEVFNTSEYKPESQTQVAVYNLESFFISPKKEYEFAYKLFEKAPKQAICFLKSDSSLKGNIGAELCALMDSRKAKRVIFVPTFPKTFKFTENGVQYQVVGGKKKVLADGIEIISSFTDRNISSCKINKLANDSIVVVDCGSLVEFDLVCKMLKSCRPPVLAGTSALAERIYDLFEISTTKVENCDIFFLQIDGKIGSLVRATLDWKEV